MCVHQSLGVTFTSAVICFPWWRRYVLYETEEGEGGRGASDRQKQRQTHRQRRSATLCPKVLFFVSASSLHGADFHMLRSENYPSFPRLSVVHAVHHTRFLGELNDDTAASCTRMTHWMPVLIFGLMREKSNLLGGRLSTTKASGRFLKQLTRTAFRWLALRLQYPQWEPFSSRMHIKRVTTEITMSIWTLFL